MQEITHLMSHLHDKKTFIITRCVLLPLEDLINFASGMVRVPFVWFIVSSMIIVTALSTVIIFFGDLVM
jgi:membrane protein DedA with SNARE-associated domain